MFTPLRKFAPPIATAALLSLTVTPSPAQTPAELASRTARGIERITQEAARVVSTAHYQAPLTLNCSDGSFCYGYFPAVGARRRLNLTRVTCSLRSAQYAAYATGKINLRTAGNVVSSVHYLPADYSTQWGYHLINSALDVQVTAGLQVGIALSMAPGSGNAYDASCTAHGTLEVLG